MLSKTTMTNNKIDIAKSNLSANSIFTSIKKNSEAPGEICRKDPVKIVSKKGYGWEP